MVEIERLGCVARCLIWEMSDYAGLIGNADYIKVFICEKEKGNYK
jgi:hypothetical protein